MIQKIIELIFLILNYGLNKDEKIGKEGRKSFPLQIF
jgi:hypothetical protein